MSRVVSQEIGLLVPLYYRSSSCKLAELTRWSAVFAEGGVLYLCAGHRVPYFAAVKDPNPVNGLLYALGIFLS